jgi:hypothetical protein
VSVSSNLRLALELHQVDERRVIAIAAAAAAGGEGFGIAAAWIPTRSGGPPLKSRRHAHGSWESEPGRL